MSNNLQVGDRVLVTRKCSDLDNGWKNTWVDNMDDHIGKIFTIQAIESTGVSFKEDGLYGYKFPPHVLVKVDLKSQPKEFRGYQVVYYGDKVHIGCKFITKVFLERLLNKFDKYQLENDMTCVDISFPKITVYDHDVTREDVQLILDGFNQQSSKPKAGDTVIFKATIKKIDCDGDYNFNDTQNGYTRPQDIEVLAILDKEN